MKQGMRMFFQEIGIKLFDIVSVKKSLQLSFYYNCHRLLHAL